MSTIDNKRAHALEIASRHGLPLNETLEAARAYLEFMNDAMAPPAKLVMTKATAPAKRKAAD